MIPLSPEAKVGGVTVAALALFGFIAFQLSGISFGSKGYEVKVMFSYVDGLQPGNKVRYAGVEVGKVKDVQTTPYGVQSVMEVKSGVQIPENSRMTISTDGLLGEKHIEIYPPNQPGDFLKDKSVVYGDNPRMLDQFLVRVEGVLTDMHALLRNLNDVLGDENVRTSLKDTAAHIAKLTANLEEFTASLSRMAMSSEGNIIDTVRNLNAMSLRLLHTSDMVEQFVQAAVDNGQTGDDLRQMILSLRNTSEKVEAMATNLEKSVATPETLNTVKDTIRNAHDVTQKANHMLGTIQGIKTSANFSLLHNLNNNQYRSDAWLQFSSGQRQFLMTGVSDIGNSNKVNFQVGVNNSSHTSQRFGVIDGQPGVGYDAWFSDRVGVSMDLLDPNAWRFKLSGRYRFGEDTQLIVRNDNLFRHPDANTYIGVQQGF